jgi:4-hydroxy-3-methylbut-2-en-1-yl diphosphate synthase IspG/GcpE
LQRKEKGNAMQEQEERTKLQKLIDYCDESPKSTVELMINDGIFAGTTLEQWDVSEEVVSNYIVSALEAIQDRDHHKFDQRAGDMLRHIIGGMEDAIEAINNRH